MAPIAVGDRIPDGNLSIINEKWEYESVSIYSLITAKKVLIFGFPGAFIPSSSWYEEPLLIRMASDAGTQETLYISVNDPCVMWGWQKSTVLRDAPNVKFLADIRAVYVTSLGLHLDLTSQGLGVRSKRFSMFLDDRKRPTPNAPRAPIAVGDIIPDGTLTFMNQSRQIEPVSVHSIIAGKKVIVFGVRGAFFPICSKHVVRSFIEKADEFKLKGVQEILCISVNDPYVLWGWRKTRFSDTTKINFLADSAAAYVTSLGLVADELSRTELGIRSKRFALLLEDCRVKVVEVRGTGKDQRTDDLDIIVAEDMLAAMVRASIKRRRDIS